MIIFFLIFIYKGYAKVITIPRGARNILIQELSPSENTIAIGSGDGKIYYLNGQM